jgi:polygalacturonase
LILVVCCCV